MAISREHTCTASRKAGLSCFEKECGKELVGTALLCSSKFFQEMNFVIKVSFAFYSRQRDRGASAKTTIYFQRTRGSAKLR